MISKYVRWLILLIFITIVCFYIYHRHHILSGLPSGPMATQSPLGFPARLAITLLNTITLMILLGSIGYDCWLVFIKKQSINSGLSASYQTYLYSTRNLIFPVIMGAVSWNMLLYGWEWLVPFWFVYVGHIDFVQHGVE